MANPFIGEIKMCGFNFAPLNWAFCNGAVMAIAQNETLFQLIGTTFGGDGQNTFALPNLQSRIPIHQGQGPGLSSRIIGQVVGEEQVTLTVNQMPLHSHPARAASNATASNPNGNVWATDGTGNIAPYSDAAPDASMAAGAIGNTGGSQPHPNLQPFLVVNFVIALFGIFPSQN